MHARSLFASDPNFLLASTFNAAVPRYPPPLPKRAAAVCAVSKRNRYGGIAKSGKLVLESAYIVASHLRILPEPVVLLLREFGAGNGGRNGFWGGFGRGGSDGWRGRKRAKLGIVGVLVILGAVGMWWIVGKELVPDSDALLGGLGLVLFGLSAEVWRRGARDWILGFCCCAVMVGLVSAKVDYGELLRSFGSSKKGLRRRRSKGRGF